MTLDEADLVWNRAALESGGPHARPGDRALAALLLAHGLAMNGGVEHAIETMFSHEFAAAISGYEFFSMPQVARLLQRIAEELRLRTE
jgi:hypothetical protein